MTRFPVFHGTLCLPRHISHETATSLCDEAIRRCHCEELCDEAISAYASRNKSGDSSLRSE